jgi:magnesium transporter
MLVDNAVYVDGRPTAPATLGEACRVCREPGKFAWVTLHEPDREEFVSAAGEFGLDEMAVEDAIEPHQRPKIERTGDRLFVVLKSVRYLEDAGRIEFGEIRAFVEPDFIVTVSYGNDPTLGSGAERWREIPTDSAEARPRSCTRSCTASSRATPRWSRVWRTTWTR